MVVRCSIWEPVTLLGSSKRLWCRCNGQMALGRRCVGGRQAILLVTATCAKGKKWELHGWSQPDMLHR